MKPTLTPTTPDDVILKLLMEDLALEADVQRRYVEDCVTTRIVVGAPRPDVARAVSDYKQWLPPMLKVWADEVAAQRGYGGARRAAWQATAILQLLRDEALDYRDERASDLYAALDRKLLSPRLDATAREGWANYFEKRIRSRLGPPSVAEQVHTAVIPSEITWQLYDDPETAGRLLRFVAVHHLSGEIADNKAAAFGLQRRAYLNHVAQAHRLVAPQIAQIRAFS